MTPQTAPAGPVPVSSLNGTTDPGSSRTGHTSNAPAQPRQLDGSPLVTTCQAGTLVMVRDEGDHWNRLSIYYRASQSPMGLTLADVGSWLAIGMNDNLCAALALLRHAYDCAQEARAATWDFALEIGKLYEAGLTTTDLRWLVVKGFVEHGAETSAYGDSHRSFTRSAGFNFLTTTCVVLTREGAAFASQVLQTATATRAAAEPPAGVEKAPAGSEIPANGETQPKATLKPHWNPARRELSIGNRLVKQFLVPAGNQEVILGAFQEEGWPEHIDDPLTGNHDIDPKARLNDAVYRLNRKQLELSIRFRTNGKGNGVHWSLVQTQNGAPTSKRSQGTAYGSIDPKHRRAIDV